MHVDRLRFLVKQNKWLLPEIGELVKEAPDLLKEIERLQMHIQLHAGDCISLNNEVDLMRGHWLDAEKRCDELKALLSRLRDHASNNATQWKDGGGSHHHPIWEEVADILGL